MRYIYRRNTATIAKPAAPANKTPVINSVKNKYNYNPASWAKNDEKAECFYVYVEKLNDNTYYCGSTRELRPRILEHREGRTKGTANKNPILKYFEIVKSREEAESREKELRDLDKNNHREFLRIIIRWQDIVRYIECD
ncbi:MAG: GIY-YIG nuclease family protein [Dehalococcoidales bacterium]|nr:GIY-YIG nuclease family protein [Dehalococcoidales bacterium]